MTRYCPLCDREMDSTECPTDGVPTVNLALITPRGEPLVPGTILADRYQVERAIGEGATGTVFLATRLGMKNRVALKVLRREVLVSAGVLKRFYQEARAVSVLDHPNIVRIVDFGLDPRTTLPFLAMEFVEGPTLRDLVLAYGRMPERRAAGLLAQVAKALVEAHQKGIVHRDLKPANVVVCMLADGDEHVKVLDFGVAKVLDAEVEKDAARLTLPGTALGTPLYMSPEQVLGAEADFRSDLYSLGCILHELVAGDPPFLAEQIAVVMQRQMSEPPPGLPVRLADGDAPSADLVALHAALLAKRKDDRPTSTAVVAWILGALARGEQIGAASMLRRSSGPAEVSLTSASPETIADLMATTGSTPKAERRAAEVTMRTNLVPEITSFVGREAALAEIDRSYDAGARLFTILGAGGTGKTRLAKRYGALRVDTYSRGGAGVWFADLTEAASLEGVLAVVGEALDAPLVGQSGEDGVSRLGLAMKARGKMLLILDNFEQVVQHAGATVGRWLELAPEARFLVTSRELLLIPGEEHHPLSPLAEEEGVALFELRAKGARPSYAPTPEDRRIEVEIVRRLDGLPLAIELAAARVGVLSLEKLHDRLSQSFQVLAGTGRSVAARHRTIRNTIDWSWNLLERWEQSALAQTAVFAGGFSLEAAEEVIDLSELDDAPSVLDVVQALRNKSLLRAGETPGLPGEVRFGLFDSIREYAAEKLEQLGLRAGVEARHTKFFLAEAEKWAEGINGSRALKYLRLLRLELDNVVALVTRTRSTRPELAARAALALEPMLAMRGPLETATSLLGTAVECAERANDQRLLVRALLAEEHARTEAGLSDEHQAMAAIQRALSIARAIHAPELEGQALMSLGTLELEAFSRVEESRALYEQALTLFRSSKQRLLEGRALVRIGYTHLEAHRLDEARGTLNEGLEITRTLDDRRYEGYALTTISFLDQLTGQLGEAAIKLERGIAIHRSVGNRRNEGMDLAYFGFVHYELGNATEAKSALDEAIKVCRDVGLRKFEGFAQAILGAFRADQGDLEGAKAAFAGALERLAVVNDPEQLVAARVLAGVLDVAQARAAGEAGRDAEKREHLTSAKRRIEETRELPREAQGSNVRISLRILATHIHRLEPQSRSPSTLTRPE